MHSSLDLYTSCSSFLENMWDIHNNLTFLQTWVEWRSYVPLCQMSRGLPGPQTSLCVCGLGVWHDEEPGAGRQGGLHPPRQPWQDLRHPCDHERVFVSETQQGKVSVQNQLEAEHQWGSWPAVCGGSQADHTSGINKSSMWAPHHRMWCHGKIK